jgi:hypothetical protein
MTDQKTPRRDDVPQGARFSRVYLDRGEPTPDSKRMRRRLAGLVDEFPELRSLSPVVARELGIDVPWGPRGPNPNWAKFLEQCDLRDVLDFVTVAFRHLEGIGVVYDTDTPSQAQWRESRRAENARRWVQEVRRILAEENVHYIVDDRGGVHFHYDEEFARNRAAAVAALQSNRYVNALHAFEGGMAALAKAPPDGKGGIRGVFSAAESIFKLILPKPPRLGRAELDGLIPLIQSIYAQEDSARARRCSAV